MRRGPRQALRAHLLQLIAAYLLLVLKRRALLRPTKVRGRVTRCTFQARDTGRAGEVDEGDFAACVAAAWVAAACSHGAGAAQPAAQPAAHALLALLAAHEDAQQCVASV